MSPKRRKDPQPEDPTAVAPRPVLVNRDVVEGLPTKLLMALRTEISLELDRRKQHGQ